MVNLSEKSKLLYDIAWKEKESQRYRRENIENKAQIYIIINGLVFTAVLTNLLLFFERINDSSILIVLFSSLVVIGISLLFSLFALIPLKSGSFEMENLIEKVEKDDYENAIKHITGNLIEFKSQREKNNDSKALSLYISYFFCLIGLIGMIVGILLFIIRI